ncbi:MAG: tetratricopeptide repeat protein [Oscillospiraceae bacterium]|nr:tetratricopeptide repeat protein [Oscillospiraceae bacterium]
MKLQIRDTGTSQDGRLHFVVVYNGKQSDSVTISPPWEIMIGKQSLRQGLQWYLEEFLELPIDNYQMRVDEIQAALSKWGRYCFDALFECGRARDWYRDARQDDLSRLQLEIVSDNASVLSWPWEVLESRDDGPLAKQCRIERRLDGIGDVQPLPEKPAAKQLNILYVIARPYGDRDIGFQTLARPLIDFANEGSWPVHIDVLRPPTFDQLCAKLDEKSNFYHIVHFDGHGGFGNLTSTSSGQLADSRATRDRFIGQHSGILVFEKDDYSADEIPAAMIGQLLRKHNIPVMVLNACRSAMHNTEDPFSSVAISLLRAGIRSVVAMSYSLWVSGAKVFVPAFYAHLFKEGDISAAMQAGRRNMYRNHMRDTLTGKVPFHDWVVPVLYQQSEESILPVLEPNAVRKHSLLQDAPKLSNYDFIGRERAIQKLERAIRKRPAGILIHGMAGEGKTTLAKGFLQWLEATNGLGLGAFWFSFEERQSLESIVNEIIGRLHGTNAMALPLGQKLSSVINILRENRFFIVWDNFESASGIEGTEVYATMAKKDREQLQQLLNALRGGKTKVFITSRSKETWLPLPDCYRLPLGGLQDEELWQYCNEIVSDLGLSPFDRKSDTYKKLMSKLGGNPLAVRAILLRLAEQPASKLLANLEEGLQIATGDEDSRRIHAALGVFERGLDKAFAPVLRLLGLHEHYGNADLIGLMLKPTGEDAPIDRCFAALERAGLCHHMGDNVYRLHPALRACLGRLHPAQEVNQKAFVDVMGGLADAYAPKQLHEQRSVFGLFGSSFYRALQLAKELDMRGDVLVLTQALAVCAQNARNFSETEKMYARLAEAAKGYGKFDSEAAAYHQLGIVAQERRDFVAAEGWYEKSLDIKLKQNDEHGSAATYGQLGNLAYLRRDFTTAEKLYNRSLSIFLNLKDECNAALIHHQLGMIAEWRRDFNAAESWYKKSLDVELKHDNEHSAASTYHQLGMIAQMQRNFFAAEKWYEKSLNIELKHGNELGAAITYHQLGTIAHERESFDDAEEWCKMSLSTKLKYGDEHGAAFTYGQLGNISQKRGDFAAAEGWYKKALEIFEQYQDDHNADIAQKNLDNLYSTIEGGTT